MAASPFEVRTLSDRLMEVVRDMILSGAIAPDVPIRQDALAADLNVSKIPLREALVRLEQDGLVVSHPNRGFFARGMSAAEVEEIFELRLKLEPDAAAEACLVADEARQDEALQVLAQLNAAAAGGMPTVGPLNRAFHMALVQPGKRALTAEITTRLHVMADRYVRKHLEHKGRHLTAEAEHQDILQAWLARDADKVRRLVADHLQHTLSDLREEFAQGAGQG
ncbi:GntR family transcriptional regulator [Brevundimonas naejangsanensis]|uniref:GntR family transcriptional regulator n=1 Tax=Brevundimonas naejangsanensis TaxID=588932 RepID=A0A172Y9T9_9CAUL|nr:GntR family transcriptional regulator [Brevundimonas naejangsanensis]ANF55987.1 GntR family transcriptional regulator [Brevundimonas naejangsanensis]